MIDDNGMQKNGQHTFAQWAYNIRVALVVLFFVILPWQTRLIYRVSPIHPDVEWGRLSLYGSELLLGILLVWAIAHAAWLWRRGAVTRQSLTRERWWIAGMLAVLVYGTIRSLFATDPVIGFQHTWWLLEAVLIIIFLRTGWFPRRAAVAGFFIGLSLAAALGIYQVTGQYAPGNKWLGLAEHRPEWGGSSVVENTGGRFLRAYGPFPHPNILGGYMVLGLLLVILSSAKPSEEVGLRMTMVVLFTIALALSFSRGAWIAWVAALTVALVARKRAARTCVALSVLTMVVVLVALWPITVTRFDRTARLEARAIEERAVSIRDGIVAWKQAPWFGVGPAQYMNTFSVQHPDTPWWQLAPPHNVALALLVEYGIVGLFLMVVTVVLFLWSFKSYRAIVWFLPLVVLMMFDHYMWSLYSGVVLIGLYSGFYTPFIHTLPTVRAQIHS